MQVLTDEFASDHPIGSDLLWVLVEVHDSFAYSTHLEQLRAERGKLQQTRWSSHRRSNCLDNVQPHVQCSSDQVIIHSNLR